MTELNQLPPDQRAVLSLVLERGKSYSEVADMLAIPESAVRDRAHAALDALASGTVAQPPSPRPATTEPSEARPLSASPAPRERSARPQRSATSSRLGGALLLGAILVVVVVVVIVLSSGGGKGSSHSSTTATGTHSTSTASSTTQPKLDKTIVLKAAESTLKASGQALVLSQGARRAFYVAIQGLPPSSGFFYAVWLYNSPSSSTPLGRAPTVSASGRMEGGGPLPNNAGNYGQLIITRETSTHPSHPGQIVMSGPFALH